MAAADELQTCFIAEEHFAQGSGTAAKGAAIAHLNLTPLVGSDPASRMGKDNSFRACRRDAAHRERRRFEPVIAHSSRINMLPDLQVCSGRNI
jgi:hypothetical protein